MRIQSVRIVNYGPFALLEDVKLGSLATIVGKNDAGKSHILRALRAFFNDSKLDEPDVHSHAGNTDDVILEVAFSSLPETIEFEEGIETTFKNENLLDSNGFLRIRKTYPRSNLSKFAVSLVTQDFGEDVFAGLPILKESEVNQRCKSAGIEVGKSGRGVTNKGKRDLLREKAMGSHAPTIARELPISVKDGLWKTIESLLPKFVMFETDTRLGVGETTFQSQFRPIVKSAVEQPDVIEAKDAFTGSIGSALQTEIDKIFEHFRRHTDAFDHLRAKPEFAWDKAVTFDILGRDSDGVENSLQRRGSGMQRLLMVAFFQYLAARQPNTLEDFVFAVEEPENCLHPGLQRELAKSFQVLADEGYQVIITSHSPVFAGASPVEDLALIVRTGGKARAFQSPNLDLSDVACQLGVEPSDQITGYSACVFVEGPSDVEFFKVVAKTLKQGGRINHDLEDCQIGFVICGGENLKHWIDLRAMCRLNRHFAVVVDSDRASLHHCVPGKKLNWKKKCEAEGGIFHILKKRDIENYLHPATIARCTHIAAQYDDFTDMKGTFGEHIYKVVKEMSCAELLEADRYEEDGSEHHELEELVVSLLSLADQ